MRITQANVKIPDDLNNHNSAENSSLNGETLVRITGNYFSLQAVQCRLGMLIATTEQFDLNESKLI